MNLAHHSSDESFDISAEVILHPDQVSDLVAYLETRRMHPGPDLTQAR